MRKANGWMVWGLACIGVLSLPASLAARDQARDARLLKLAESKIAGIGSDAKVGVQVEDTVATLTGTVSSVGMRERVGRDVARVDGVSRVENQVQVAVVAGGDAEIADRAAREVRKYAYYTIFDDIELAVENGVLAVKGSVLQPWRKDDIGRLLAFVPGVNKVDNRLEVLPLSSFDSELRLRLTRAIYGNPVLSRYGMQVNPPIHIIVKNGNVMLSGVVNSEMEKTVAELAARSAGAYFGFENNLRLETKVAAARP